MNRGHGDGTLLTGHFHSAFPLFQRPWLLNRTPRQQLLSGEQSQLTSKWLSNLTIIGSDNGLSPERRQAITWTNAGLLSMGLLRTYFCEIWIGILSFSFKKMQLKMLSAKMWPFCAGRDELTDFSWFACTYTHRGLVMPYSVMHCGSHWFRFKSS